MPTLGGAESKPAIVDVERTNRFRSGNFHVGEIVFPQPSSDPVEPFGSVDASRSRNDQGIPLLSKLVYCSERMGHGIPRWFQSRDAVMLVNNTVKVQNDRS